MKSILFAILFVSSVAHSQWNYYQSGGCIGPNDYCFVSDDGSQVYFMFAFNDTSMFKVYVDTLDFTQSTVLKLSGNSTEYVRGDGELITFPTIPTNTNQLTNGSGFITDVSGKLNISDTVAMLNPYLSEVGAAGTYATISALNAKQNQLNGTGFVKASGTTITYDNNTYLTSEVDGSATNEIELPSFTGNDGKYLSLVSGAAQWVVLPTYTAGTGISISGGNVITNTAPDQTVSITGSNGITLTGTYPNFTVAKTKRQETYSGTTNASGIYTVTFGTAYSAAPNIQANIIGGSDTQIIRITSISTTGFTVTVRNRVDVVGLLPSWSNVNGANVDVLITEK